MTTVAYKDGVMAADTQVSGGYTKLASIVKVERTPQGYLVGACGSSAYCYKVRSWASDTKTPDAPPMPENDDDNAIMVKPDGTIVLIWKVGLTEVAAPFYAIGSGRYHALGVMAFGGSAIEAVEVSIQLDLGTGGEVISVSQNRAA